MSDTRQPSKITGLVLCINVGELQRPVEVVKDELQTLAESRKQKLAEISDADPTDIHHVGKLQRELALIESEYKLRDDPMKIRLGHINT